MLLLMCVGILFSTSCQARCSKKRPTPTVQTETTTVATEAPTETATVPTETTTVPTTLPTEALTTPQPGTTAGAATRPHEYPFFAAIVNSYDRTLSRCGGSVIADQWVLTAVDCKWGNSLLVVLGGHDLTAGETSMKYFEIESMIEHEDYSDLTYQNDVMLVKLKEKIDFTDGFSPICLPSKSFTDGSYNNFGTVVGYGQSKQILKNDTLQIESAEKCNKAGGWYASAVNEDHICTRPGRVSCLSDIGSPLLVERNGRLTQVGMSSWATPTGVAGCADASLPVVYTKTESYVEWIERKMGTEVCLN